MSIPFTFTSVADLPDGRRVTCSIDVPTDHPVTTPTGNNARNFGELIEHTEIAQIGVAMVLRNLLRADLQRVEDANEDAIEAAFGKAPF